MIRPPRHQKGDTHIADRTKLGLMADKNKTKPSTLQKKRKIDGTDKEDSPNPDQAEGGNPADITPPSNGEQSSEPTDGAIPETAKSNTNVSANNIPAPHISDYNVPAFRILRKLIKAGVRAKNNYCTLSKALEENRLPRGLCPKKIPLSIPDVPIKFQLAWEKAHSDLNRSLTEILKEHWLERGKTLEVQYKETLIPLQERSSAVEVAHILSLLKKSEDETLEELKAKDAKKKIPKTNTVEEEETATEEPN